MLQLGPTTSTRYTVMGELCLCILSSINLAFVILLSLLNTIRQFIVFTVTELLVYSTFTVMCCSKAALLLVHFTVIYCNCYTIYPDYCNCFTE